MNGTVIQYGVSAEKKGLVKLVYTECIASGTRDYREFTMLLVMKADGTVDKVYPRDVHLVIPAPPETVFTEWICKQYNYVPKADEWVDIETGKKRFTEDSLRVKFLLEQ